MENSAVPLVVLYADRLEAVRDNELAAGRTISLEIFSSPGGRRFHFKDADGYAPAVWSNH